MMRDIIVKKIIMINSDNFISTYFLKFYLHIHQNKEMIICWLLLID